MRLYKYRINFNYFSKMHQRYLNDSIVWIKYITHQNYYQSNKKAAQLSEYRSRNAGTVVYRQDHFLKIQRRIFVPELINTNFNKQLQLKPDYLYKYFIITRSSGYRFYGKGNREKSKDYVGLKKKRYQVPYGKMYKFVSTRKRQLFTTHIV